MNSINYQNNISFKSGHLKVFTKASETDIKKIRLMLGEIKFSIQDVFTKEGIGATVPQGSQNTIIDLRNASRAQIVKMIKFVRELAQKKNFPIKIRYYKENYQNNLTPKGQLGFDNADAQLKLSIQGKL